MIEGQYFERTTAASHTFIELMDRYEKEHVAPKLRHRGLKGYMANLRGFFGTRRPPVLSSSYVWSPGATVTDFLANCLA